MLQCCCDGSRGRIAKTHDACRTFGLWRITIDALHETQHDVAISRIRDDDERGAARDCCNFDRLTHHARRRIHRLRFVEPNSFNDLLRVFRRKVLELNDEDALVGRRCHRIELQGEGLDLFEERACRRNDETIRRCIHLNGERHTRLARALCKGAANRARDANCRCLRQRKQVHRESIGRGLLLKCFSDRENLREVFLRRSHDERVTRRVADDAHAAIATRSARWSVHAFNRARELFGIAALHRNQTRRRKSRVVRLVEFSDNCFDATHRNRARTHHERVRQLIRAATHHIFGHRRRRRCWRLFTRLRWRCRLRSRCLWTERFVDRVRDAARVCVHKRDHAELARAIELLGVQLRDEFTNARPLSIFRTHHERVGTRVCNDAH